MDLLELNKRGMDGVAEDDGEWMGEDGDSGYVVRASQQTEMNDKVNHQHSHQ